MANQSPDRRHVLEILAKAGAASQFPGFSKWVFAHQHQHASEAIEQPRPAHYRPSFFTDEDYRTIEILTEMIIPADESPGAREAGVSEFIDFMAAHGDKDLGEPMRSGLHQLQRRATEKGGQTFAGLPQPQQVMLLRDLASQGRSRPGGSPEQAFFQLLRRYTVMGYYTSRIGLGELRYPGLRFYSQSPECPHHNDPEHKHLAPGF